MGSRLGIAGGRGRLPAGLIGMIGLLAAVEGSLAVKHDSLARRVTLAARFAARESVGSATRCELIGLGDSVIKFGFDPAEVSRGTGLRGVNLAIPGGPPPLADALLRRALAAGARPEVVVVGHLSLSGDAWDLVPEFGEVLDTAGAYELARDLGDPALFAAVSLARALPSVRLRLPIRALAWSRLTGRPGGDGGAGRGGAAASMRHWSIGSGSDRRRAASVADERTDRNVRAGVFDSAWPVVAGFERAFCRLVARAQAHGARVFWLVPPLAPFAQARRDALGLEADHTRTLRAIHERLPGVVVLDARRVAIPASEFFDSCHVNEKGAARLSAAVAAALARERIGHAAPTSHRWVALAPDAPPPPLIAAGAEAGATRTR